MKMLVWVIAIFNISFAQNKISVSYGRLVRLPQIKSAFVEDRNVDVWLPPNYTPQRKYCVLYMHDGQMLYDSTTTWNKQEWQVDETMQGLGNTKSTKDCIVVGIWNNGKKRFVEYFPEDALQFIQHKADTIGWQSRVGAYTPQANNYLQYIIKELKPLVDSMFSTKTNAANTFIAGSSMGALISLYAICKYPNVFGGAACISPHWPILYTNQKNYFPNLLIQYFNKNLPSASKHKIYFDYGTEGLDSLYKVHQLKVDSVMKQKNYSTTSWISREFVGKNHTEKDWAERLFIPFQFLLKK
jgi:enterochelin esterase-like enzyme